MTGRASKRPGCSMCGKCCLELGYEISMTPGDYRRWKHQGRTDILNYAFIPPGRSGRGYLWFDPVNKLEMDRCPFLTKIEPGRYTCSIQDTKPKVCKNFWCEWTYGVGSRAVPFKAADGWSEKAKKLGYGQNRKSDSDKS